MSETGEPAESRRGALLDALRRAVLTAPAHTESGLRSAAATGGALPEPLAAYVAKVREQSYRITDQDFEITVAAAVGAALRGVDAGTRALMEGR